MTKSSQKSKNRFSELDAYLTKTEENFKGGNTVKSEGFITLEVNNVIRVQFMSEIREYEGKKVKNGKFVFVKLLGANFDKIKSYENGKLTEKELESGLVYGLTLNHQILEEEIKALGVLVGRTAIITRISNVMDEDGSIRYARYGVFEEKEEAY